MSYGATLADLALNAPPATAAQACSTLTELGMAGDLEAVGSLGLALAQTLGLIAEPEQAYLNVASFDAFLNDVRVPALIRVYASLYSPRCLLANFAQLQDLALKVSASDDIAAFQRIVAADSIFADEALRAFALCAFIDHASAQERFSPGDGLQTFGHLLNVIHRSCRFVAGCDVDMSLRVGREFVAKCASLRSLFFALYHEFGHSTLDAAKGRAMPTVSRSLFSGSSQTIVIDGRYEQLVAAIPAALRAARTSNGAPFSDGDARSIVLSSGARILMSCKGEGRAAFMHVSLTQAGGAIDLREAAAYALVILRVLDVDPADAACIYPQSGVFHCEFAGHGPDDAALAIRIAALDFANLTAGLGADSEAWIKRLDELGRFGEKEADLKRALGLVPNAIIVYGSPNAIPDSDRCLAIRSGRVTQIERDEMSAYFNAGVRFAEATVVAALLEAGTTAGIRLIGSAPDVWNTLGTSLCVAQSSQLTQFVGPFPAAIVAVIKELTSGGADIDAPLTGGGRSMLHDAATRSLDLTQTLIDTGADPNHGDVAGFTALSYAVAYGPAAIVDLLLRRDASVAIADVQGNLPLHTAVARDNAAIVSALLAKHADVHARNGAGEVPIMRARSESIYDMLRAAGAEIEVARVDRMTPLIVATQRGDTTIAGRLLRDGAEASAANDLGETALHFAAMLPDSSAQRKLLASLFAVGVEVDEETNDGITPLLVAAASANPGTVTLLIERGATLDHQAGNGKTALIFASDGRAEYSRDFSRCDRMLQTVKLLLDHGGDPNVADRDGWTPLLWSAQGFYIPLLTLLLEGGATATLTARDGLTALHCAAGQSAVGMCQALVAAGADVNAVDDAGNTPLSLAKQSSDSWAAETIDLLIAAGANEKLVAVT